MGDWLELHGLDHETCLRLLDEIGRESARIPADRNDPDQQSSSFDPDSVWPIVTAAMCKFLPERQDFIEDTFARSKIIAIPAQGKPRKALTLDHGPAEYPTIMYNYFGQVSDLFVVAHEFGHALQIRASEGQFMPPVMREVCAFISEGALLSYCLDEGIDRKDSFLEYWYKSNQRYFGKHVEKLKLCLDKVGGDYQYGWNYPIARLLALRIEANLSPELVWGVFRGDYSIKRVMNHLEI